MTVTSNPSAVYSQTQIYGGLLKLMETIPYPQISVKEILYEAKIARKTFYRNFTSKDDVLNSIVKKILNDYAQRIMNMQSEKLDDFFDIVFNIAEENRKFYNLLSKNKMMYIFFEELNYFIPLFHKKFCSECSFFNNLTDAQTDYAIAFNIGAIWNIILKWISEDMKTPKQEICNGIARYLTQNII